MPPIARSIIATNVAAPPSGTVYADDFSGVVGAPQSLGGRSAVGSPVPFTWAASGNAANVLVNDGATIQQNSDTTGDANTIFTAPAFDPGIPDQYVQARPVVGVSAANLRIALACGSYHNGVLLRRQNVSTIRFSQHINQAQGTTIFDYVFVAGAIYRMELVNSGPDRIVSFYENTGGGWVLIPDASNPYTLAGNFTGGDHVAVVARGTFDSVGIWTEFEGGLL